MDLKNDLISICSTINIFFKSPYKIKKIIFMYINNYPKPEPKKLQFKNFFLLSFTDSSKRYAFFRKKPDCAQYISDMLKDISESKMTSNKEVKESILF